MASFRKNLLEPNGNPDVFIHAWKADRFTSAQPFQENKWGWHPDTLNLLQELNPKSLLVQEAREFSEFNDLESLPTATQSRLASMFYSAGVANGLKQEHEVLNDFRYDLVIKTRIDVDYHKPVILAELGLDLNAINVSHTHQYMRIGDSYPISVGGNYSSMSDTWVASSSSNMDEISLIYPQFHLIHNVIKPYQYGECFIGFKRYAAGLGLKMVDVPYHLFR